jgi:hypothetical protein
MILYRASSGYRTSGADQRFTDLRPDVAGHVAPGPRCGHRGKGSRWSLVAGMAGVLASFVAFGVGVAPMSRADEVAYVVNVTVRPGYNFPNAQAALDYGYSLCDRMRAGEGFPQLMALVKSDFNTDDEYQADYLLIQSSQELCPAMIWELRRTAAGYRPTSPTS